ncbi:MAG: hypothetical protein ACJ8F3_08695 [Xanthobacteraceae bacterium]
MDRAQNKNLIPAQPGEVRNPRGRPKGSRNKLGEAFIAALHEDFSEHGLEVIQRVRVEEPAQYLKVVASILPRELKVEHVDSLTEAEIDQRLQHLTVLLGAEVGITLISPRKPHPVKD